MAAELTPTEEAAAVLGIAEFELRDAVAANRVPHRVQVAVAEYIKAVDRYIGCR